MSTGQCTTVQDANGLSTLGNMPTFQLFRLILKRISENVPGVPRPQPEMNLKTMPSYLTYITGTWRVMQRREEAQ